MSNKSTQFTPSFIVSVIFFSLVTVYAGNISSGTNMALGVSKGEYQESSLDASSQMKWKTCYGAGLWTKMNITEHVLTLADFMISRDFSVDERNQLTVAYNSIAFNANLGVGYPLASHLKVIGFGGFGIEKGWEEYNTSPYYTSDTVLQNTETITSYADFGYSYWGVQASGQLRLMYKSVGLQFGYSRELIRFAESGAVNMPHVHRISLGLVTTFFGE